MPARQLRDQFFIWSTDVTIRLRSTTKVKIKTNLANKQATHQTSLFPMTDRKARSWILSWSVPTYQISHIGKNTAIRRSCVQIQSHELRMSLHFPKLHDKALSLWVKDTLRQKTRFSPLHKEKTILLWSWRSQNPEMIFVLPFLRAKLIRKEKRSAISSQFMKSSKIHKQKPYSSAIWRIH